MRPVILEFQVSLNLGEFFLSEWERWSDELFVESLEDPANSFALQTKVSLKWFELDNISTFETQFELIDWELKEHTDQDDLQRRDSFDGFFYEFRRIDWRMSLEQFKK